MANKHRYTPKEVANAIKQSKGMLYLTAKRLGCSYQTVLNYCTRYKIVEEARKSQRGEMVDLAETRLLQSIENGEAWGIAFCLKTLGKDRGYVEQQKLALTDPSGEQPWEPTVGLAALLEAARQALTPPTNGQAVNGTQPLMLPPAAEEEDEA
jgi:hypothetical protein